jgi:hypothetical protein
VCGDSRAALARLVGLQVCEHHHMKLWRRARSALLRLLRVITWPVTWPLWKLGMAWVRRDHEVGAGFYDKLAAWNSQHFGPYHRSTAARPA